MRWATTRHPMPLDEPDSADAGDVMGNPHDDEERLIAAAQADPTAFAALYRRYVERMYRYLRAHTRDDDAADLTQQVFLRALDALPRYRAGAAPFAAWLFRIAHNALVDAGRRRRDETPWDELPEPAAPDGDTGDPEALALRREARERLRAAIAALDTPKRELLALRFAGRLSAPEIAAVVGKRPEAVKKQLTRILHALREHLDDVQ